MSATVVQHSSFRQALPWVCFVSLLFTLSYCGRGALSPLLPYLEEDYGVGHAQATSLLLMQGIGMTVSIAACGFLLSRIRPRNMAVLSLCLSGLCFMAVPLCQGLGEARVVFLAFGLTAGLYFGAGMATLGSLVDYRDWGKAVGIHELAPNLGFILFPLIAQALLSFTSWKGVLAIWDAMMFLTGLAFLRFGRGGQDYAEPPSLGDSLGLLRHPTLWMFMYVMAFALVGEYAVYTILPLHLVQSFGQSADNASYLLSLTRLAAPFMVILGGWASDVFPVRRFLTVTLSLHTLALVIMGLPWFHLALGGMAAQASAIALTYPGLFKLLGECYPGGRQPVVISLVLPASGLVGSGFAPSLLGLAGETIGFGPGLIILSLFSLACIPLVLMARRFEG